MADDNFWQDEEDNFWKNQETSFQKGKSDKVKKTVEKFQATPEEMQLTNPSDEDQLKAVGHGLVKGVTDLAGGTENAVGTLGQYSEDANRLAEDPSLMNMAKSVGHNALMNAGTLLGPLGKLPLPIDDKKAFGIPYHPIDKPMDWLSMPRTLGSLIPKPEDYQNYALQQATEDQEAMTPGGGASAIAEVAPQAIGALMGLRGPEKPLLDTAQLNPKGTGPVNSRIEQPSINQGISPKTLLPLLKLKSPLLGRLAESLMGPSSAPPGMDNGFQQVLPSKTGPQFGPKQGEPVSSLPPNDENAQTFTDWSKDRSRIPSDQSLIPEPPSNPVNPNYPEIPPDYDTSPVFQNSEIPMGPEATDPDVFNSPSEQYTAQSVQDMANQIEAELSARQMSNQPTNINALARRNLIAPGEEDFWQTQIDNPVDVPENPPPTLENQAPIGGRTDINLPGQTQMNPQEAMRRQGQGNLNLPHDTQVDAEYNSSDMRKMGLPVQNDIATVNERPVNQFPGHDINEPDVPQWVRDKQFSDTGPYGQGQGPDVNSVSRPDDEENEMWFRQQIAANKFDKAEKMLRARFGNDYVNYLLNGMDIEDFDLHK